MNELNPLFDILKTILSFSVILTVLVAVHELGHFWVAKAFGMHVEAFAVMMGGIRESSLDDLREKKLASRGMVASVYAGVVLLSIVGALTHNQALLATALFGLAIPIPIWISLRLGYLYGRRIDESLKPLVFSMIGATVILGLATRFQNLRLDQVLSLAVMASLVGLLVLYYSPLGFKTEDDERMGVGFINLNGEAHEVKYRPVWKVAERNGTEYSLLLLPLGGFARIAGMNPKPDGSEVNVPGGFYSKSPFARLMTLFAGPLFSVLLGSLILFVDYSTFGEERAQNTPVLGSVYLEGPAGKAGLRADDRIVSLDGKPVQTFFDVVSYVRERPLQPISFVAERKGKEFTGTFTPKKDERPTKVLGNDLNLTRERRIQGKINIGPTTKFVPVGPAEAFSLAASKPGDAAMDFLDTFRSAEEAKESVGGPASIASVAHESTKRGLHALFWLAAMLSISLGFMNLLPIPPLDGGQMMVAFFELIRGGKRMSMALQKRVMEVGMMLVILLMVFAWTQDVSRIMGGK